MNEGREIDLLELDEASAMAPQPSRITGVCLMPHQLRALHRCRELEKSGWVSALSESDVSIDTNIGVFGDTQGSGKSHVMLALIASDQISQANTERITSYAGGRIHVRAPEHLLHVKTNVIVVPHVLISKWESFMTCIPWAKILTISRKKHLDKLTVSSLKDLDVLLVTNTFYNEVVRIISSLDLKPHRLIIDEADTIAITSSLSLEVSFAWYVTANYHNLLFPNGKIRYEPTTKRNVSCCKGIGPQGHVRSLFMDLHKGMPQDIWKRIVVKNVVETVHTSMRLGKVIHHEIPCVTPYCVRVANGDVDAAVLACLTTGNHADVIHLIDPENKHCIESAGAGMSQVFVNRLQDIEHHLAFLQKNQNTLSIITAETLEQDRDDLKHHIEFINNRINRDDVCCICLDPIKSIAITPCCMTKLCLECVAQWVTLNKSCVTCREPMTFSDLHTVTTCKETRVGISDTSDGTSKEFGKHLSKIHNLEILLRYHVGSHVMICNASHTTVRSIHDCLDNIQRPFDILQGGHRQLAQVVKAYQDGDTETMILNPNQYMGGDNLQVTTDLIFIHAIGVDQEKMVVGNVNRPGRSHDLHVWHLMHSAEPTYASITSPRSED